MTGIKLRTSGIGSNHLATTTDLNWPMFKFPKSVIEVPLRLCQKRPEIIKIILNIFGTKRVKCFSFLFGSFGIRNFVNVIQNRSVIILNQQNKNHISKS